MNWITIGIIAFLVIGAYTIYLDSSQTGGSFVDGMWDWFKAMGSNLKSITGYAIGLEWLPEGENGNRTAEHG